MKVCTLISRGVIDIVAVVLTVLIVGVALLYHSKPSSSQTTSSNTQVEGGAPACIVNLTNTKTIEGKSL